MRATLELEPIGVVITQNVNFIHGFLGVKLAKHITHVRRAIVPAPYETVLDLVSSVVGKAKISKWTVGHTLPASTWQDFDFVRATISA
jgi:hypothetical protein